MGLPIGLRRAAPLILSFTVAACGQAALTSSPDATSIQTPGSSPAAPAASAPSTPSAAATSSSISPTVPPTGWQTAGSMVVSRLGFRSTLLGDGTILVVGNEACVPAGEPTGSERAEVYDPATDRWSEVGSLNKERAFPALVALADGRALVLGGSNSQSQPYSSTKIYSPTTGTWSNGPLMLQAGARDAVTLSDGSVLAAGKSAAEILEPGASAWRRTAAPPSTFFVQRLLLLADGKALAAGESNGEVGLTGLRAFDPASELWPAFAAPDVLRPELVALANGSLLALGDDEGGGHVQRYDATTDSWSEAAQMTIGRIRAQVTTLPDGRVLVTGGVPLRSEAVDQGYSVTEGAPLKSTEIYDPAADKWSRGPSLRHARQGGHAITLLDGSVLLFGGYLETPPDLEPGGDTGTPGPCAEPLKTAERLFVIP